MSNLIGTAPDQVPVNGMLGDMAFQDSDSVKVTDLAYTGTLTGSTGILNIGSGQVYKDASGNVGIGTSSPTAKLAITQSTAGATALSVTGVAGAINYDYQGSGSSYFDSTNFYFRNIGGSVTYASITYGTNSAFQLTSSTGYSVLAIKSATGSAAYLDFVVNNVGTARLVSDSNSMLAFATGSAATERMRINSSGNVGIGTSSPLSTLHVIKTSSGVLTTGLILQNSVDGNAGGINSAIELQFAPSAWAGGSSLNRYSYIRGYNGGAGNPTYLVFGTNSASSDPTERMRIDSSGNVGIGTSSPTAKLQVIAGSVAELIIGYSGTSTNYIDANTQIFRTGGKSEQMRVDASGNVGIGTSSPVHKLDVVGAVRSTSAASFYTQGSANIGVNNGLVLGTLAKNVSPSAGTGAIQIVSNDATNPLQASMSLITDVTSNTNYRLAFHCIEQGIAFRNITLCESGGNVGIGTSNPAVKLDVSGGLRVNTPFNQIVQACSTGGITTGGYIRYASNGAGSYLYQINTAAAGNFSTAKTAYTIDSSGNVGIGTISPQAKFDVLSSGLTFDTGTAQLVARTDGPYISIGHQNWAGTSYAAIGGTVTDGTANTLGVMRFFTRATTADANLTERMRIDPYGNVGIGTSTGTAKLHVSSSSTTAYGLISQTPTVGLVAGDRVNMAYITNGRGAYNDGLRFINYRDSTGSGIGDWQTESYAIERNIDNVAAQSSVRFGSSYLRLDTAGVERLRINSSGNVGIGTSSPTGKLDVVGDNTTIAQRASSTAQVGGGVWSMASTFWSTPTYTGTGIQQFGSTAAGTTAGLTNANLGVLNFQNGSGALILTNTGTPIVFANSSQERMRITASGNVSIGSPADAAVLYIASDATGTDFRSLSSKAGIALNFNGSGISYYDSDTTVFRASMSGGSTERMRIDSSGNLLVGTTSSSGKLTVAGTISCSSGFASDVTLTDTTTTTYTAGTYYTLPGTINVTLGSTYLVSILFTYDNYTHHNWCGGGIIGLIFWQAGGANTTWTIPMDTHLDGAQTITIKANTSQFSRTLAWTPSVTKTVTTGGSIVVRLKLISTF